MLFFKSGEDHKNFILSCIELNERFLNEDKQIIEDAKASIRREKNDLVNGFLRESAARRINYEKERIKRCSQSIKKYKAINAELQQSYDRRYGKYAEVRLKLLRGGKE